MSGFSIDTSEILKLAADVTSAADEIVDKTRPIVRDAAKAMKATMRADMAGSKYFGQISPAITFESVGKGSVVGADIGPVKGSPGSLANIAYFGGANGGGGTVRDPLEAAQESEPALLAGLSAIIGDLL